MSSKQKATQQLKYVILLLLLINHVVCKPVMHTYIDESAPEISYSSYFENWKQAWLGAGWEIKVVSLQDAMINPLYSKFQQRMDEKNLSHSPRHSYMRNLAMSGATKHGGYYSDIFVFPLQKVTSDDIDEEGYIKLPNSGELTFHDGVGGSIVSGNLAAWDRINLYLVDHIEKNAYDSFQKLEKKDGFIHFERNNMLINVFGRHEPGICEKTKSKFVARLHKYDLRIMNVRPMNKKLRDMIIGRWFQFYRQHCWYGVIQSSQLGVPFSDPNVRRRL